eukprot:7690809-Pyramimonas_sp.AAC.1
MARLYPGGARLGGPEHPPGGLHGDLRAARPAGGNLLRLQHAGVYILMTGQSYAGSMGIFSMTDHDEPRHGHCRMDR